MMENSARRPTAASFRLHQFKRIQEVATMTDPPTAGEAQDHGSAAAAGHGRGSRRKALLTLVKGWRLPAFLLVAIITIITGLHYKDLSNPGEESEQFATESPPSFNIFVSNPNASVNVHVDVMCSEGTSPMPCTTASTAQALLNVNVYPASLSSGTVLITSNVNYFPDAAVSLPFSSYGDPPGSARIYEDEIPIGPDTSKGELSFNIPNVVEEVRGSVFGRLPVIGDLGGPDVRPAMLTENDAGTSTLEDLIYHPTQQPWAQNNLQYMDKPDAYEALHGGYGATLFWNPNVLSITESLEDITGVVSTQRVDYVTPPATVNGMAYTWNADTLLQPQFKSTDPAAVDSQTSNAFIAGILLGIAGAAVLGFLQELPPHPERGEPRSVRQK
jgi:hypothetical protein